MTSAENALGNMDTATFNKLVTASTAALLQVETLSEFTGINDCISTIRAAVYPNVIGSLFLGGLCLWFNVRVIRRNGRGYSSMADGIISRLRNAVGAIQWAGILAPGDGSDISIMGILGELLFMTRVWGEPSTKY